MSPVTSTPSAKLRVLLVEDSEEDAALVLLALRTGTWDLHWQRVDNGPKLKESLAENSWDLILSDYNMPGFDGLSALRIIREHGLQIPVILISGTIGETLAVAAMKAGANDYLMKDNLQRLIPAVERELREHQSRLEGEKALKLSEEKLQQAQKMELVGRLSGGIAHDFNNLLAVILGNVDLLIEKQKEISENSSELAGIERAALQATSLVRQLLSFSRKQAVQAKTFDMHAAMRDFLPMLRMMVGDSVRVELSTRAHRHRVHMDPVQLEQVVLNLASNARDAMHKSGTLQFETQDAEFNRQDIPAVENAAPGSYLVLRVSDTGTGIDPETLEKIFEPFFTTKEVGKGTGLGLSTTIDIMRQCGGWIAVTSRVGIGTTFHLHFPLCLDEPQSLAPHAQESKPGGQGQCVFVVEDNAELRKLTREVLLIGGYQVVDCRDYEELEATAAKSFKPDLLLTDLRVPGKGSQKSIPGLMEKWPGMKIVYMSGYSMDDAASLGMTPGNFHFLEKPFTPSKLLQTLREAFTVTAKDGGGNGA